MCFWKKLHLGVYFFYMVAPHYQNAQLRSTGWVIALRWWYVPIVFFFGLFAAKDIRVVDTTALLFGALAFVLIANTFFFFYFRKLSSIGLVSENMDIVNMCQIGLDLAFFFVVVLCTGAGNTGNMFFFLPIIVSIFMFGLFGAVIVALLSGSLVFLSALLFPAALTLIPGGDASIPLFQLPTPALVESGVTSLVYLFVAFFGGFVFKLIRARDLLRLEQTTILAHQLRTPLSAIKWTTKMLLDGDAGKNTPEQEQLLTKSFELNQRMVTLVNNMLLASRLESEKTVYNFSSVKFEELIREIIGHMLPISTKKDIQIEFIPPKEALPPWSVDPDKMRDALQNLLDNAIKYTEKGGKVTVSVELEEGHLHLVVRDNGIGIPEDVKEKVFSRFFRAPNAIAFGTSGSGLGLSIVQSIVQRHGGRIWFDDVSGGGTAFHVLLPFRH